ncbi:hypothetical protein [Streptomyces sp. NPDC088760]|uniref:hypothetical protein n=1 Tax=Streptomyces sp. NPDC088760 TaxID=3365890 RepID=UPI003820B692
MDESRRFPSGAAARLRKPAPPPALCGFLLLLALVFAVSYAVGAAAGPVAPGMHGTGTSRGGGAGGMDDMGDLHGGSR